MSKRLDIVILICTIVIIGIDVNKRIVSMHIMTNMRTMRIQPGRSILRF